MAFSLSGEPTGCQGVPGGPPGSLELAALLGHRRVRDGLAVVRQFVVLGVPTAIPGKATRETVAPRRSIVVVAILDILGVKLLSWA